MKLYLILAFMLSLCGIAAAGLIHRYEFNGDFSDDFYGPALIPVHAETSFFDSGVWTWTSYTHPGGGLLVNTSLPNPATYSLRIVFKYNTINTVWTKIISFSGYNSDTHYFSSDYGLYFNHGNLYLYPFLNNSNVFFQPDTWYELVLARDAEGVVFVFLNPFGQQRQLILQYPDISNSYIPSEYQGSYHWGLFYDDTTTTGEWTSGGSVTLIEIHSDPLWLTSVQNLDIVLAGSNLSLSWDSYDGAESYNVYSSQDPINGGWDLHANTVDTNLSINPGDTRRFFRVKAMWE